MVPLDTRPSARSNTFLRTSMDCGEGAEGQGVFVRETGVCRNQQCGQRGGGGTIRTCEVADTIKPRHRLFPPHQPVCLAWVLSALSRSIKKSLTVAWCLSRRLAMRSSTMSFTLLSDWDTWGRGE